MHLIRLIREISSARERTPQIPNLFHEFDQSRRRARSRSPRCPPGMKFPQTNLLISFVEFVDHLLLGLENPCDECDIFDEAQKIGIGSDIGESIRMPCFNAVFGLKPTPDVVPLDGVMPSVSGCKMLCIGPMCRYAANLPLLLKIMGDETRTNCAWMGFAEEGEEPLDWEMKGALMKAVQYFEKGLGLAPNGSLLRPSSPPILPLQHGRQGRTRHVGVHALSQGKEGQRRLHTLPGAICGLVDGWPLISEERKKNFYYKRDRMIREMTELLGGNDIFLFPSWPCTALFHGQPLFAPINFSCLFNSLALPVVQVPTGLDRHGLPLGIQVVGAPGSDRLLIAVAKDLEEGFGGWVPAEHRRDFA